MLWTAACPVISFTPRIFKIPSPKLISLARSYHSSRAMSSSMGTSNLSFIDIGANLLDPMYQGSYHGSDKAYHPPDLPAVLERAWDAGVSKIIITAGNLEEAKAALALARTHGEFLATATIGSGRQGSSHFFYSFTEAFLYLKGIPITRIIQYTSTPFLVDFLNNFHGLL